jgi:hypothetical protein
MRITRHPRDEFGDEDQGHSPGKQLVSTPAGPRHVRQAARRRPLAAIRFSA